MESSALGTLIVSMVAAIAKRRSKLPEEKRPMTHLIIDECQNFLTSRIKTIIRETRKFKLAVTLAQQELGGDMAPDLRRVVTRTTNVKIVGRSSREETRETAALVGVESEMVATLPKGVFFYSAANRPAVLIQGRTDRLGSSGGVSDATWESVKGQQLRYFYRYIGRQAEPGGIEDEPFESTAEEVHESAAPAETPATAPKQVARAPRHEAIPKGPAEKPNEKLVTAKEETRRAKRVKQPPKQPAGKKRPKYRFE
jgi:hypothetical protein